jgi:hypothetical protein
MKDKPENTIAPEMAEKEFESMCDFFDVDLDEEFDAEGQAGFDRCKKKITKAIGDGRLTIGDNGAPTFVTKAGTALTFSEPTGATLLTKVSDDDPIRKMHAYVQSLTGGKASPAKLTVRDTGVLFAIVTLFMSELA